MSHVAALANSFETSLFCQRLNQLASDSRASTGLQNLRNATQQLVTSAEAISSRVIEHLPQFTLHDGTHLWNVLSFMEELAGGKEAIANLGAGDCAMAVWACFIHDLGMVIEAGELSALDFADHCDTTSQAEGKLGPTDEQHAKHWRAYRDGHEHWESIRRDPDSEPSRMKLGIIRAAFVRDTHARFDTHTGHCRIADWLGFLQENGRPIAQALEHYALAKRIIPVAVSHNQDIAWLPRQLESLTTCENVHAENLGLSLGTIHWTWIGWLLRLADVFDCDASRTPRILFERITDRRSLIEWRKHLAIPEKPQWQHGEDNALAFTCHHCPGPDVEKAIHQIIGWMNGEIEKCRAARLDVAKTSRLPLFLPGRAKIDILEREGDYIYQDIEFRLDRDAVIELLMGESLYGGPELALRELVQNALDAVHLRDMRNQLAIAIKKTGSTDKPRQLHQHWEPGESGQVNVQWGTDPEKGHWVKVRDNGIGMTIGEMKRYLTQIGKSYYKSDNFRAEQELMRRHGILCTAISQFGIGFLSVFMLADRVEIHTRPLGASDGPDKAKPDWQEFGRFPFRAEIHRPHGLLVFYPDEGVRDYGTTVTLWLKEGFVFPAWDEAGLLKQLKTEFYEPVFKNGIGERFDPRMHELQMHNVINKGTTLLDPAFEVCRFVVWPLYPVLLEYEDQSLTLNSTFHFTHLAQIDSGKIITTSEQWELSIPELKDLGWQALDWVDVDVNGQGFASGSGTRIRISFGHPDVGAFKSWSVDEVALLPDYLTSGNHRMLIGALAEPSIPDPAWRYQCLVNGIRIFPGFLPSSHERDCRLMGVLEGLPILPGAGAWVWIDLRGDAMPRLRADRSSPVKSQTSAWKTALSSVYKRWLATWPDELPAWVIGLLSGSNLAPKAKFLEQPRDLIIASKDLAALAAAWISEQSVVSQLLDRLPGYEPRRLPRDIGVYRHSFRTCTYKLDASLEATIDMATCLNGSPIIRGQVYHSIEEADQAFARMAPYRELDSALMKQSSDELWKTAFGMNKFPSIPPNAWTHGVRLHVCSQAFWPDLQHGHPMIKGQELADYIEELHLVGPLRVIRNSGPLEQDWLAEYDLSFPFTAFALPRLSHVEIDWMSEECYRNLFMLPFLLGAEPKVWREILEQPLPLSKLMLFMPNPVHYEWLFAEHPREDWAWGSASALWDLTTGQVLYADGVHTESSLRSQGKPLMEWLGLST